ncbi:MAG TPA: YchJ family metal-binding protein, partial [Noviherbaspirillum sp.]|nr:YchJ family metal-binding protein [Noviherbaspirillum sp.]
MNKSSNKPCPCGGQNYETCCARYIEGEALAQTAEQLMRSRYSAYTLGK